LENSKDFLRHELVKMTPYEKNLEIWKQLWITVDHCQLLCVIIDARNPLFFKNDDLEQFILANNKKLLLVLNKADLVLPETR